MSRGYLLADKDIPPGGLVNDKRQANLKGSGRLGKARCKSATVTQL